MQRRLPLLVATLVFPLLGCTQYAMPRLYGPGSAERQRARAVHYDPYPDQRMGPAIEGGRPTAYLHPPSEAVRAQQNNPRFGTLSP